MASRKQSFPLILIVGVLLVLLAAAMAPAPAAAQQQEYCRDSLAGLMECQDYMYGGGARASASCCAAYDAAFNADPFCLCYVADGTFARATGKDIDVARALQIPVSCGQVAPPIELCSMQGLVLPPYEPEGTPPAVPAAAAPQPQAAASAPAAMQPQPSPQGGSSVAPPPSFTTTPPPPPPTSAAHPVLTAPVIVLIVGAAIAAMAA